MNASRTTQRGPSASTVAAARYFARHPEVTAAFLAAKFKVSPSTIHRAAWWKNRHATTSGEPA